MPKRLVVNADDFGFTTDVNEGIVEAHTAGILTSTTLMANGTAFEDAVELARRHPTLDIGCHLVLIGGRAARPPHDPLPRNVGELLAALALRRLEIYEELAAQVIRVVNAGLSPTHLDTHKHTHLAPPVLEAVARIAQEFHVQWVRRPFDLPMTAARGAAPWLRRTSSDGLRFLRRRFERVLKEHGCRWTDHFAGFQLTGRFRANELAELIRALPEGTTEFMCHPGRCREELRSARTRLKESREAELAALVDPEVRSALREAGVTLTPFSHL